MPELKTIKVISIESGAEMVINADDYNEEVHQFNGKAEDAPTTTPEIPVVEKSKDVPIITPETTPVIEKSEDVPIITPETTPITQPETAPIITPETTPATPSMSIREAVLSLNPHDDKHWTIPGLPAMDAIVEVLGSEEITRKDVDRVASDVNRQTIQDIVQNGSNI